LNRQDAKAAKFSKFGFTFLGVPVERVLKRISAVNVVDHA
jgi:hypothetical protein